jgi:hypothetical protein
MPKNSGNGNMEESTIAVCLVPQELDADICLSVFQVPPIPAVHRCSFLFLGPEKLFQ